MKNFVKLFWTIALTAIIGFSMAACGGGGDEGNDPLQGTWTSTVEGNKLTFTDNNWVWKKSNGSNIGKGTFSQTATQITLDLTNWSPGDDTWDTERHDTGTFDYVINGKSLTFTHRSGQDLTIPTNWTK